VNGAHVPCACTPAAQHGYVSTSGCGSSVYFEFKFVNAAVLPRPSARSPHEASLLESNDGLLHRVAVCVGLLRSMQKLKFRPASFSTTLPCTSRQQAGASSGRLQRARLE